MTLLLDERNAVRGGQQPRIRSVPAYVSSAGEEALEVAELAGLFLDPFQELVLVDSLGERADGKWAAPDVGLVLSRQNGKGSILEARELAGLFLIGEEVIIHSAHEQATASEQFRRLLNLIEGVGEFERRILKVVRGKGNEAIELRSGQRIFFKTRTSGGGRGFTADCLIYDEAMILPDSFVASVSPTLAARSLMTKTGVQTWYTGSAVDQQKNEHGVAFARIREQGLKGDPGLAYFEWSIEGDDPGRIELEVLEDPQNWAAANPSLGIRIAPEYVERELIKLGPRGFAVERLSVGDWPRTDGEGDRIIPMAVWRACASQAAPVDGDPTLALDASPDHAWATIAAATPGEVPTVEVVEHHKGVDWVVEKAAQFHVPFIIDPRGPASSLIPDLQEAGVQLIEVSTQDYIRACAQFVDAVTQQTVRYPPPQPELDEAVAGATTRSVGDSWAWSRKSASVDISPLVAASLALWGAATQAPGEHVWDLNEVAERMRAEGRL